jgi:hypothetical protein
MQEWKYLALLFGVVFIAGCTIPGISTGGGTGLIIKSFSPSDTTVEPNTPILLSLIVQNTGGAVATNIHADLGGLTQDWSIDGGRSRSIPNLNPPDATRGITQGEQDEEDWTLSAPGLSSQFNYPLSVQVSYDYTTTSDNLIRATSIDYYKINKPQTGVVESKTTAGPISVTVTAPNAVFAGSTVPVYFQFHNQGSGRAKDDTLNINVQGSGLDCRGKSQIKMIQGSDGFLRCDASTAGVTTFIDLRVSVTASYTYTINAAASITVNPTPV